MDDFRTRAIYYRTAMSLAKELLKRGDITQSEYDYIDTIIAKKYGVSSCTICRE